ncbi:hypothetical protein HYW59_02935 [Candidatus Kaiserbacteria bacterium]|nr:hypothetical protein [Candidatus Kaiserbacteria bacterium]
MSEQLNFSEEREDDTSTRSEVEDAAKEALIHVMSRYKIPLDLMQETAERVKDGLRSYRRASTQTDELSQLKLITERIVEGSFTQKVRHTDIVMTEFMRHLNHGLAD